MGAEELRTFLTDHRYAVFATTTPRGRAQARPIAFSVVGSRFWFATVAGRRLDNLRRAAWASAVVTSGESEDHRAVAIDGPVQIVDQPPAEVVAHWQALHGSGAEWAAAWLALEPKLLLSYRAEASTRR
jgi:hypothetical protein